MNKINKGIDLVKSKFMIKFKQKVFKGKKYDVKYVLDINKKSKDLLIVFTACTKVGQTARYNYIRTVEGYKCNKLFILDDFGFDNRGAYYLGKDKDFAIEKDVKILIEKIIKELNIRRSVFIGSSKGGYAALYFGLDFKNSSIITGAPQYKLGNYLNLPGHENILKYIMGDTEETSIDYLNLLMKRKLEEKKNNNNKIYLHYSINEENYVSDLEHLIKDVEYFNIELIKDEETYSGHAELTNYFPGFIKENLDKEFVR